MAQIARDLERLGLPLESLYVAPFGLFVVLVVLEKWRHRAPEDAMAKVQRQRYAEANRGSTSHGLTVALGCAAGIVCVVAMDWFGFGFGG
jgi:type IV secretory pathway TrbD component